MIYAVKFRGSVEVESRILDESPHDALALAFSRLEPQTIQVHSLRPETVEAEEGGSLWYFVGWCESCLPKRVPVFGCDGGVQTEDGCAFCPPCSAKLLAHMEGHPHPEPLLGGDDEDGSLEDEMWRARADRERDRRDDPIEDALSAALSVAEEDAAKALDLLDRIVKAATRVGCPIDLCPLVGEARALLAHGETT